MKKLFLRLTKYMLKYRFRPKEEFSQNFIICEDVIENLVNVAEISKSDKVIEIGSGTGFLTEKLLEKAKVVYAIEIDENLCKLLRNELSDFIEDGKLKLFCASYKYFFEQKEDCCEKAKLVSFAPYAESKNIIETIALKNVKKAAIVFQKEFVEKLLAFPGFAEYTATTVIANTFYNIKEHFDVSKECFYPVPKVESKAVEFEAKKEKLFESFEETKKYIEFVNSIFRHKNKDLANALKKAGFESYNNISEQLLKEKVMLLEVEEIISIFKNLRLLASKK